MRKWLLTSGKAGAFKGLKAAGRLLSPLCDCCEVFAPNANSLVEPCCKLACIANRHFMPRSHFDLKKVLSFIKVNNVGNRIETRHEIYVF